MLVRRIAPALLLVACGASSSDAATGMMPGPDAAAPAPAGPPGVGFVGRFSLAEPDAPLAAWPGVRILARFDGTAISVKLEELPEPDEVGPSEWDVIVDGTITRKLVLENGVHPYELAKDLPKGEHVVELYRRSEAQDGRTRFLGFDITGTLLAPPARPSRRIQIVGDSSTAGFGIEGVGMGPDCPGPDYAAKWENFHRSFGALLGETFQADVDGLAFSGKGLAKNIWRPDTDTLGKLYRLADPLDPDSTYDFTSFVPDMILVMVGGNDFDLGQPTDDGPPTLEAFTAAYTDLVTTMRTAYPAAHLFLTVSTSLRDDEPPGRNVRTNVSSAVDAVVRARVNAGDTRVYREEPPVATDAELTACGTHGNPEHQRRLAADLAPSIRARLGW